MKVNIGDKKYTWAWPPQSYNSAGLDLNKSRPHTVKGKVENERSFPFYSFKGGRYIANPNEMVKLLSEIDFEEHVIKCNACENELCRYFVEKGKKGSVDGILGLRYTGYLAAYRQREDGLLGLQCSCGMGDTRLSTQEKIKYPSKFPALVRHSSKDEAKFNEANSHFSTIKEDK